MRFAFISRHEPTQSQFVLARQDDIELVHVGDFDAFKVDSDFLTNREDGPFDGAVVVHPAAALRLCKSHLIGVFENANRAPVGEKPRFEALAFYVYDLMG